MRDLNTDPDFIRETYTPATEIANAPQPFGPTPEAAGASVRFQGYTSSTADPGIGDLPLDRDLGVHKNLTSSAVFLAFNDGGVIKKVQLT